LFDDARIFGDVDILLSFESGNDTIFRRIASYTIPLELLLGLAAPGAAMARLRKEYVGDRRTAGLRLQLTPSERIELEFRAASVGMTLSEFCRIVLLSDLKKPAPSRRDPRALRALAVEISRVGNNLNQLAHIANQRNALPNERALDAVTERIIASLDKVMEL
jgi:hypothetical protein